MAKEKWWHRIRLPNMARTATEEDRRKSLVDLRTPLSEPVSVCDDRVLPPFPTAQEVVDKQIIDDLNALAKIRDGD